MANLYSIVDNRNWSPIETAPANSSLNLHMRHLKTISRSDSARADKSVGLYGGQHSCFFFFSVAAWEV